MSRDLTAGGVSLWVAERSIAGRGKSKYKGRSQDGVALTYSKSSKETRMVGVG